MEEGGLEDHLEKNSEWRLHGWLWRCHQRTKSPETSQKPWGTYLFNVGCQSKSGISTKISWSNLGPAYVSSRHTLTFLRYRFPTTKRIAAGHPTPCCWEAVNQLCLRTWVVTISSLLTPPITEMNTTCPKHTVIYSNKNTMKVKNVSARSNGPLLNDFVSSVHFKAGKYEVALPWQEGRTHPCHSTTIQVCEEIARPIAHTSTRSSQPSGVIW